MVAISLGWNCSSASKGVDMGIRKTRAQGYRTCPFDEMNSNYQGVVQCIRDDFKYFCDPAYLILRKFPTDHRYYPGESLVYNTRYNFIFNHESPGHADLYVTQKWSGGINHYIDNNFERFIERYSRRIDNFRRYLSSGEPVSFLITTPETGLVDLRSALSGKCRYEIRRFDVDDMTKYTDHMKIMTVS
jgi:hypothetical protein